MGSSQHPMFTEAMRNHFMELQRIAENHQSFMKSIQKPFEQRLTDYDKKFLAGIKIKL